ncbi:MBL fold metallo-hydrolase [Terrabacter terrigena]|uniref:beta-lactamase n=1 Tax=Terrabacter terrigena TaxID=574718 RepID=A0ABW3N354_9MICO
MSAQQLLEGVWLVGSGTHPHALTDPHDCHSYLVWDGTGGFVVDCGTGLGSDTWLANIGSVCDPARVGGVLLTHYHADHAGGSAAATAAGLDVMAHPLAAKALLAGDQAATQLNRAKAAGIYPSDYTLAPANVEPLPPGRRLRSGGIEVDVVDAPGHCDGHLVFLWDGPEGRTLFSGDCVFAGGRISMQAIPDCRLDLYASTLIDLAFRDIDILLPGHQTLVLEGAAAQLKQAAASFSRLIPPPNVLT